MCGCVCVYGLVPELLLCSAIGLISPDNVVMIYYRPVMATRWTVAAVRKLSLWSYKKVFSLQTHTQEGCLADSDCGLGDFDLCFRNKTSL